jgi:hypothetical protein
MLEVCERFPAIGTIAGYQALPRGERILYDQYTMIKLENEARTPALKIESMRK